MTEKLNNDDLQKVTGGQFDTSIQKVIKARKTIVVYTVLDKNSQVLWTFAPGDDVTVYPDSYLPSRFNNEEPWIYVKVPLSYPRDAGAVCLTGEDLSYWLS